MTADEAGRTSQTYRVIVIGAGFSGICLGAKLKAAGIDDFIILEKAGALGGTWRDNTYPGAECDVPSALYSYSFEPGTDWRYKWSRQEQILAYQDRVSAQHGLREHLLFDHAVVAARYDDQRRRWEVDCASGSRFEAQHLVTATGQLSRPAVPDIAGQDVFQGVRFHSAQWDHAVSLQGKRVAVIGTAASAVQLVPAIAATVARLTVFQRSANWVLPKKNRPYQAWEQRLVRRWPVLMRLYRLSLSLQAEWLLLPAMRNNRLIQSALRRTALRHLNRTVSDPLLVSQLTPDYPIGARRVLFSDHFYPALTRPNVELVTAPIDSFSASGIRDTDGVSRDFDVVIYATGFRTNPFLAGLDIHGSGGQSLGSSWAGGAHAYLGINTHGFPNLHMLYGPNTNLGHNSILIMFEVQARYIVECIRGMKRDALAAMDVKAEVEQAYNHTLQQRLDKMVWRKVAHSWYMDGGRITNNWPGSTGEYRRRLRRVRWSDYRLWPASESGGSERATGSLPAGE